MKVELDALNTGFKGIKVVSVQYFHGDLQPIEKTLLEDRMYLLFGTSQWGAKVFLIYILQNSISKTNILTGEFDRTETTNHVVDINLIPGTFSISVLLEFGGPGF